MVVWVFAGGGDSEINSLIPFLSSNYKGCTFERKTPYRRKPGPKYGKPEKGSSLGRTGKSLAEQIKTELRIALFNKSPDLILVIDDLDCNDAKVRKKFFLDAIDSISNTKGLKKLVGFAAPEIEAWLIADWDHTFASDIDFRGRHEGMKWFLSHKHVPFDNPESFSSLNPEKNTCEEKLSELITMASQKDESKKRFSKGVHTSRMLMMLNPEIISKKCPYFRDFHLCLSRLCSKP